MNLHTTLRRTVWLLGFSLTSLCSLSAHAQGADTTAADPGDVDLARKHFGQGLKLYKDGDFDAALVQFERAYAVKPNFKVLYNIAQCHFELHQYVEARDTLQRYLKDAAGTLEMERQIRVESDVSDLQRRIAHITLTVNVTGATVFVDGKKVGVTPLSAAVDVSEGQRTISVETPDRGSKQRVVRVGGGEDQTISIDFAAPSATPTTAATPQAKTESPKPRASNGLGVGFWVTGGAALALGAGAGVTGFLALRAQEDRKDDLQTFGVTQGQLDDSRKRAKTFALTSDILAGTAIVCAGVATVLLITHDSGGGEQVGLGVGPGNVTLRGRF